MSRTREQASEGSLLTTEEVAELLQVPVATIYGWRVRREGPPAIRVGRHLRFRREAVERWLLDRESAGSGSRD